MPPTVLSDKAIVDLVAGTLDNLGRLRFNQIAQELVRYEVLGRLMRRDKMKFDSGTGIQRNLMLNHSDAAKHVGLYAEDDVNVADVLGKIDIPWRHTTTNYAFERREMLMNSGGEKIVDLLTTRRSDAMLALAELMESAFWSKPDSSSDESEPYGVYYWIVPHATTGFYGGNPSGFSAGAGNLDSTTHPKWSNYTGSYTAVSKADLIAKMRRAYRQIRFESPVDIPDYRRGRGDQYRIYVNENTLEDMETLGESQNENLGRDLASMDDTMAFRRNPIIWVPYLDANDTDPVYMLNFAWFYPVFLRGDYLRETEAKAVPNQHNVFAVHVDLTWNLLCTDRRRHAVLTK